MATVEGDANSDDVLKEQTECIRRIISLEEAVLPVLQTGFGKSVITGGQRYVFAIKYLLTCKTNNRNLKHTPNSKMADSCYLALDASFPHCSPQIIPNERHFVIYFIYFIYFATYKLQCGKRKQIMTSIRDYALKVIRN